MPRRTWLLLFGLTLAVRLPFFFDAYLHIDESTFILVADDVLKGNLPYVNLWEAKPPAAFMALAGFMVLFGRSVVAVRLGGALVVFFTALVLERTGRRAFGGRAGLWAALTWIVFASAKPGYYAVMTEHLAMLPAALAFWLLLTRRSTWAPGLLLGLAVQFRPNLVVLVAGVCLYLLAVDREDGFAAGFRRTLVFGASSLVPTLAVAGLYWAAGQWDALWLYGVKGQMAITDSAQPYDGHPAVVLFRILRRLVEPRNAILGIGAVLGLFALRRAHPEGVVVRRPLPLIAAFLAFTVLSILATRRINNHYLIQIVPWLGLLVGVFLAWNGRLAAHRWLLAAVVGIGLFFPLYEAPRKVFRMLGAEEFPDDEGTRVARYLAAHDAAGKYVFLLDGHIAYFLVDARIPTRMAHPSLITKPYIYDALGGSPEEEIRSIFAHRPVYVATEDEHWYLDRSPKARDLLWSILAEDYEEVERIDDIGIYRRR